MARRTTDTNEPTPELPAPAAKTQDDVLVYISRGHAIIANWNTGRAHKAPGPGLQANIPQQHRVRLEPGLSFCPGASWALVQETQSYLRAVKAGAMKPVAGHNADLEADLQRIKPAALASMVDKSHSVETLRRIQELEQQHGGDARTAVLEALEARLDHLKVAVRRHDRRRRDQRRAHRGRSSL